ncbi:hypothetical protein NQ314_019433 [Rhamnusium bicolor]|uniref:Peroxisomal targeting signal 1 receptor n=1 Tax=Rhamnusium bicolor TaxID=1586634 RepID=A0AAV8WN58_9CUCU|nr:hypothetical protein NQ314_019433 [Rhamnusium bicolor]
MAFRPLTEAECGQANPLSRLTSHITRDHTFSDSHGQVLQSSSDQLVEQFLQETRALPQTFRMDDLMREMHEIESQRSALPPIPASTEVNNEAVWAEIISQEQSDRDFQALADVWTADILNSQPGPSDVIIIDRKLGDPLTDESKFVYSKFMRFMKNEEQTDVNYEEGKLTEQEAEAWTNEYFHNEAKEDTEVAELWAEEHLKSNGNMYPKYILIQLSTRKEYEFSEENPMLDLPKPLERGKQLLEEGDFPSAVLCFEAAVKQEPENVEAWLLLGTTQAENEQDPSAIPALNTCLQLEPSNLRALMALAVSYTNESYYNQACHMLLNWLKHNPKYSSMVPPNLNMTSGQVTSLINTSQHKLVQDIFIKAAQRQPKDVDYEVQCGLGVLFNLSGEYDKAADCFTTALSVKPGDARLWNRLGATLANGSRPEEAVEAYHHALNIAPGFIRARYNVGITCINLNAYRAQHIFPPVSLLAAISIFVFITNFVILNRRQQNTFLTALNQQARGKDIANSGTMSQMSGTIWSTLRMCISLMNRGDLKPAVDSKDLQELNKAFAID